jgi:hypothetical protein
VPSPFVVGLNPVVSRTRDLVHKVLDHGAQAVARGGARCAPQVISLSWCPADARGTAQLLDRGAQAVARGTAR